MKRSLGWAAVAASVGVIALSLVCSAPQPAVGVNWSPRRFCEELARLGEVWETHPGKAAAVVCKRRGDATPWAELVELADQPAEVFSKERGRLHILPDDAGQFYPTRHHIQIGRLLIRGHPEELARIVEILQP